MKRTNLLLPVIIVILGILFSSCATNEKLNTSSGRAEVIIYNVEKTDVFEALINSLLSRGYSLKSQSEYKLVMTKSHDDFLDLTMDLLSGNYRDGSPEHRVSFNIIHYLDGIRVVTDIEIVKNPGSRSEQINNLSVNSSMAQDYQIYLNEIKSSLESSAALKGRGKIGVQFDKNQIVDVVEGSNAEQAGLLKGDIVLFIDGVAATESGFDNMMMISGEPGTTFLLEIERDEQHIQISVVRGEP